MKYFTLLAALFCGQVHAQDFTKSTQSIVKSFNEMWKKVGEPNAYMSIIKNMVKSTGSVDAGKIYVYTEQKMLNVNEPFTVSCDVTIKVLGTKNNYGIVIGDASNPYSGSYIFTVDAGGVYRIEQAGTRGLSTLKGAYPNNAIKHEAGAINSLKVMYNITDKNKKGYYAFYCNNTLLDTLTPGLRRNGFTGIAHGNDGEVHFTNYNLTQDVYAIVEKKTTLKDGLTVIESAAAVDFWPFRKGVSATVSYNFDNSFLLDNTSSILTDYNLIYKYGPYTTSELASAKEQEVVKEIMSIRKPYLLDYSKDLSVYFSRIVKNGYLDPHIYVYQTIVYSKNRSVEENFVNVEFVPTKNLLTHTFITQTAKTSTGFAKSFFKVWEAAKQFPAFQSILGERLDPKYASIIKSTFSIDGTTNNVIETSSSLSGTYYKTNIATGIDKVTALSTQNAWFIKIKEAFGKGYAYTEKIYDSKGYLEEKDIIFTKALPIMDDEQRIEAQLIINFDAKTGLYVCKLQIVSFP